MHHPLRTANTCMQCSEEAHSDDDARLCFTRCSPGRSGLVMAREQKMKWSVTDDGVGGDSESDESPLSRTRDHP